MNNKTPYIEYVKHRNASEKVLSWISHSQYLAKTAPATEEIEHILDYLVSESAPEHIEKMSYPEAKSNAEKWLKTQIKKGNDISETEKDTEVVLDFKDGFKIV